MQSRFSWQPQLAQAVREMTSLSRWPDEAFDSVVVEHLRGVPYGLTALVGRTAPGGNSSLRVVWDSVDCISYLFEQAASHASTFKSRGMASLELASTKKYEARVAGQFDHVVVTSPTDCSMFQALPGAHLEDDRISILPNGVDLDYFSPGLPETREPDSLVVSGKMSYHANVAMVLNLVNSILPLVREEIPGVKLVIAGKDPPPIIQRMAGIPGVTITGTVPDLRPYLQTAAVAVAPLVYGAGIQNKVLEAMACETPVVASRQAASALCALPGQDLLVAEDDRSFARAIVDLIADPQRRSSIGASGRRYVETYHAWDQIAEDLERILHQTLAAEPRSG
jgi:glycosyltransferase involved in cell wall biosynthesis